MPVSVVCESSANVNAALRESLGSSVGGGYSADDSKIDSNADGGDCLQSKLVASAKRVLLSKIEYEEVTNYSQSMLDSLKSKYIVLKPSPNAGYNNHGNHNENIGNRKDSAASTCVGGGGISSNNGSGMNGYVAETNGNSAKQQRSNPNELPQPKRILYARENVRIGWKNSSRKWQIGVGMMNVGNTCYLNSTLQAIFHVPSMANWLLSDTQHMERCDAADAGCIICAMAKTLQASQSSQNAIRPYFVYSKLKSICKHLVMGRQEDAHEFLRYLVEAMEKSYLSRFRNFKDLDQYSKETTPLNQILGGYLKSSVRCLACGHVSVTFQHFQDLLLDIRKADTVEEALDGYFSRERLEDMGYKCEACKKKVSATKQFSLERAPIALCIQLKRFSMLGTKINKQITIKPRLELTKFSSRKNPGEQLTYKLVAMVTHLGASQHCGHYTAIGLTESGTYYNYDDSYVRPISVQSVCNTNAYIIFYEMDSTPIRHNVTSTQVSGAPDSKDNYQKLNGCTTGLTPVIYNGRPSPQRIIGPQLPFGANINNNKSNFPLTSNGNKLVANRHSSSMPVNSSKIMIHFKNNSAAAKTSPTSATSTTSAASIPGSSNTSNSQIQNSLLLGTGKFQEPANSKFTLASAANKGQTTTVSNGNESSSDDDGNEVTSSTTQKILSFNESSSNTKNMKGTLPSMPKLFDHSHLLSHDHLPLPQLFTKSSPKSLVPYESASDDDDEEPIEKLSSKTLDNSRNPLKRTSSLSAEEDDDAAVKVKKSTVTNLTANGNPGSQSNSRLKTDAIDEIFNLNKRNANSNNHTNTVNKPSTSTSPSKKCKSNAAQRLLTSTVIVASDEDENENGFHLHEPRSTFKRSHSTPPSPPVIKTQTGLWQVTTLQPVTASVSLPEDVKLSSYKNPKNPFSAHSAKNDLFSKRPKLNQEKRTSMSSSARGNGYHGDSISNATVGELLKQTHHSYGENVLTWNGTESEIAKEIKEEARQQRRRDWEEEEENDDMDRGRQKKVKSHKEISLNPPGYNPFQEQDNQRRWKNGGGQHRFYGGGGGNFRRNNFQRNKGSGAFKRFNYKYQRTQQRGNNYNDHHRRAS